MKNFRPTFPLVTVTAIVALQALGLWVVAGVFVLETVTQPSNSLAGAIFLDMLIVVSAAAISLVAVLFVRGVSATRSAIVFSQMTIVGIGIASAQGDQPRWDVALALIIPAALATIFMLGSREVSRHLAPDA